MRPLILSKPLLRIPGSPPAFCWLVRWTSEGSGRLTAPRGPRERSEWGGLKRDTRISVLRGPAVVDCSSRVSEASRC